MVGRRGLAVQSEGAEADEVDISGCGGMCCWNGVTRCFTVAVTFGSPFGDGAKCTRLSTGLFSAAVEEGSKKSSRGAKSLCCFAGGPSSPPMAELERLPLVAMVEPYVVDGLEFSRRRSVVLLFILSTATWLARSHVNSGMWICGYLLSTIAPTPLQYIPRATLTRVIPTDSRNAFREPTEP